MKICKMLRSVLEYFCTVYLLYEKNTHEPNGKTLLYVGRMFNLSLFYINISWYMFYFILWDFCRAASSFWHFTEESWTILVVELFASRFYISNRSLVWLCQTLVVFSFNSAQTLLLHVNFIKKTSPQKIHSLCIKSLFFW